MNVLVTGATGFVGRHVVRRLVRGGHRVRALVHADRGGLPREVERIAGDVTEPRSVRSAAEGTEACVHLVAIIAERGGRTFRRVNAEGTRSVVRALAEAGTRRLVHVSALGAGPDERYPYLRSKWDGEEAVRAGGLEWTVLRPSTVFGEGAGFFRPIVWSLRWMPFYPLVAGGRTRFSPIAIEDLAECIARALEGAGAGRTIDVGGPDVLELGEIVRIVADSLGKRRAMVPLPLAAARPFAWIQELRRNPLVTNEQLDMVVLDNSCDPQSVPRAFGFEPRRFAGSDLRWLARL